MSLVTAFAELKNLIEWTSHLSRDALHVHIGLVIFLGLAAVLRAPGRFHRALGWLLIVVLVGECFDALNALSSNRSPNWVGSLKDIVNTMFWPSVLVYFGPLAARVLRLAPVHDALTAEQAARGGRDRR